MSVRGKSFQSRLLGSTMFASAMLIASPALAQENPAQEVADEGNVNEGEVSANADGSENEQEIVVTGSRIRRTDLTSSSPVVVTSAAEIGVSGSIANVEDFLNELPQFVPATTGASNNPGNGLATINLRGAGVARTLVLVDGKRYVPSTLGGIIDINTIPTPLVERVEVVTGGASAVYGSDALAGVVNFILKKDFSGVELNGQYNITERGDASIFTTSLTVGGNFGDNRGNAALLVSYTDREAAFAADREYSRVVLLDSVPALNAAGTVASGGCVPGSQNRFGLGTRVAPGAPSTLGNREACFVPGGSGAVPNLLLPGVGATGTTFNPDGTARPFVDPDDLFNFAPANYLQLPQQRFLGTAIAHYEISPTFVPFARATFAYNKVPRELASTPVSNVFTFNLGNPFLTPSGRNAICSALDTNPAVPGVQSPDPATCPALAAADTLVPGVSIARRQEEVGPRQQPQETYSFQIQLGMRGDLGSDFNYEGFYQYGRTAVNAQVRNDVSFDRFQNSIQVIRDASGNIVCRDPVARAAGCVPQNIFGAGNVSPAAANYIRLSAQSQTVVKDEVAGLSVSGLLPFNLFATERVGIAVGGEYRAISGRFDPDEALRRQVLGFNRTSPTSGKFDIKEVFAELSVPIASGLGFIHDLRATGAVRYSDYSTIGGVTTYAGGVEFAPIRDIRFRAQYQKAIRAPNIGELFAGRGNNFPAAVDPCSARQPAASQTAAIRAACVANGIPAALVFNFPGNTQVETIIGGNANLIEETSDTYTAGVVFTPTFLRGFNATVDYYKINIDQFIGTVGGTTANILARCFGPAIGGNPTNPICQAITRRNDSTIANVSGLNGNIASAKFEGVDFGFDYRTTLGFGLFDKETAVALISRGTRALKQTTRADPVDRIIDCVGKYGGGLCGNPTPKWRIATSASFSNGPVGFTLQHRWFDDVRDERQFIFPNPDGVPPVMASFTAIDRPSSRIGDYHIFDASLNFDVNENYELTFGIENVFDKATPVVGDAADEQNNTYPSFYDPFGRAFFAAAKLRF